MAAVLRLALAAAFLTATARGTRSARAHVRMAGGVKQPRPLARRSLEQLSLAAPHLSHLPKLVVFDLDNTLWTPELYTLRQLPVAWKDVWLLDAAEDALFELGSHPRWAGTQVAIASRTSKVAWAHALLASFALPAAGGGEKTVRELISYAEIYVGSKVKHFERLREQSGVPYEEMLFFDDALGGKYGNCEAIAAEGVLSVHTPDGLTTERWREGLRAFSELKASRGSMAHVVMADGSLRSLAGGDGSRQASPRRGGALIEGTVVKYFSDKRYGFIRPNGAKSDVFFHLNSVEKGVEVRPAITVAFELGTNSRGQPECTRVRRAASDRADMVRLRCFSMNQPFASLVAHGYKTLETRNGTMFKDTRGERVLLHVGQRTYPDGGKHQDIMRRAGCSEADISRLTSLPAGFTRGSIVAILELGETDLLDREARCTLAVENQACAYGDEMGQYATRVQRVQWLTSPVSMRGQAGLFDVEVPSTAIPRGWLDGTGESKVTDPSDAEYTETDLVFNLEV
ncbi:hypothetical protein AB1Y20_015049 [Prymnesium parvum]|uniref:CSD domain-containing protein n=1 Tax=Prymnesium parvum TaxID=97485 RepID=A0AB34JWP8_PRYPA